MDQTPSGSGRKSNSPPPNQGGDNSPRAGMGWTKFNVLLDVASYMAAQEGVVQESGLSPETSAEVSRHMQLSHMLNNLDVEPIVHITPGDNTRENASAHVSNPQVYMKFESSEEPPISISSASPESESPSFVATPKKPAPAIVSTSLEVDAMDEDLSNTVATPLVSPNVVPANREFTCQVASGCKGTQAFLRQARKCISDYFGRNKKCTREIRNPVIWCRSCYQKKAYQTGWQLVKLDLIHDQLTRIDAQEPGVTYTVVLKMAEQERLNAHNNGGTAPAKNQFDKSYNAPLPILQDIYTSWVNNGPQNINDCIELLAYIRSIFVLNGDRHTDLVQIPSFELLANFACLTSKDNEGRAREAIVANRPARDFRTFNVVPFEPPLGPLTAPAAANTNLDENTTDELTPEGHDGEYTEADIIKQSDSEHDEVITPSKKRKHDATRRLNAKERDFEVARSAKRRKGSSGQTSLQSVEGNDNGNKRQTIIFEEEPELGLPLCATPHNFFLDFPGEAGGIRRLKPKAASMEPLSTRSFLPLKPTPRLQLPKSPLPDNRP